jgi:hypothetical protein
VIVRAQPATWQHAVQLGAQGLYAAADDTLATLSQPGGTWTSLALSTSASHRRQIGATAEAARLDDEALNCATDTESIADALVGLAADAIASGDAEQAAAWHADASQPAETGWRTLTRWHWVGAERALLVGDQATATEHARAALAVCTGQSPRHESKSRIISAAVTGRVDDLPAVSPLLRAEGWVTLEWPLALVAADHSQATRSGGSTKPPLSGHAAWLTASWATGRAATYSIEDSLPAALRPTWRRHPGVRRLRAERPPAGGE